MSRYLGLTLLLIGNFAIAKPMELTCDYPLSPEKQTQIAHYGFTVSDIGKPWLTKTWTFDTDDFDSEKATAKRVLTYYKGQKGAGSTQDVPYTVNPTQIVFTYKGYSGYYDEVINRKTLRDEKSDKYGEDNDCRINEIDTSENVF